MSNASICPECHGPHSRAEHSAVDAAKVTAEEIIAFLFDEYPDNAMNRDGATERVAAIITRHLAAQAPTEKQLYAAIIELGQRYQEAIKGDAPNAIRGAGNR